MRRKKGNGTTQEWIEGGSRAYQGGNKVQNLQYSLSRDLHSNRAAFFTLKDDFELLEIQESSPSAGEFAKYKLSRLASRSVFGCLVTMENVTLLSLDRIQLSSKVLAILSTMLGLRILSVTLFGFQDVNSFIASSPAPSSLRYLQVRCAENYDLPRNHLLGSAVYRIIKASVVTLEELHLKAATLLDLGSISSFSRQIEQIMELTFVSLKCFVIGDVTESLELLPEFLERHRCSLQHFEVEYSGRDAELEVSEIPLLDSFQGTCWNFSAIYSLEPDSDFLAITEFTVDAIEAEVLAAIMHVSQNLRILNVWEIINDSPTGSRYICEVCISFFELLMLILS